MSGPRLELPGFSGDIDELLSAIEQGELDVACVPLSVISEKAVEWTKRGSISLDEAATFILKALNLVDRKLSAILPADPPEAEADPAHLENAEDDGAAQLAERLAAYKLFKDVASALRRYEEEQAQRYVRQPEVFAKPSPPAVKLEDLLFALQRIWERMPAAETREVEGDGLTVAMCCQAILDRLRSCGETCFSDLFAGHSNRRQVVVTFLALLELFRQGLIILRQDIPYGEIFIAAATRETEAVQAS